jgi:tryptophan synthase alpha subunit
LSQIRAVWKFADAAVVGSAIVEQIALAATPAEAVERVEQFVNDLLPLEQR